MIRRRLMLLVAGLLTVVLGVLAIAVFVVTRQALLAEVERDVTTRAESLAAAVGREADAVADDYVSRFATEDMVAMVYGDNGDLLARSETLPTRTVPFPELSSLDLDAVELDIDGPLVVAMRHADLADGSAVQVVVGRSPDRAYDALTTLARVLIPATLLALLATGVGVHLLMRRALRPLERLGLEAGRIADTGDHGERIDQNYRPDEVGVLAATVDSMLVSLSQAHTAATDASDKLRDFLADASHELRAPLAIATSSLDLLDRSDRLDRDLLRDLRTEIELMARVVSQLLVMARTGEEARSADAPVLPAEVVRAAVHRWAGAERCIDVSGIAAIEDVVVIGNEDQLRQVFDVLLDNATRYSAPGDRIVLTGSTHAGVVEICVADTGAGIAAEDLPSVFDRFHRGSRGGTGLGLAIARHIVEAHGGTITATSTVGQGSRFRVSVPTFCPADEPPIVSPPTLQNDYVAADGK